MKDIHLNLFLILYNIFESNYLHVLRYYYEK